jgi:hypothetical protein
MKKLLLLVFFAMIGLSQTNAQWGTCEPNALYQDSTFGVYPPPLSSNNPDGGIVEKACVNSDFFFIWTVKIPDMIETTILNINVDSIIIEAEGAILNIPAGMTYAMNPIEGVFTPEDSLACITLFGTPTIAGTYDLKIVMTVYSQDLAIFGGSQTFELPSNLLPGAEGNYFLEVLPNGDPSCFVDTDDLLAESFSIRNLPNPFSDFTNIEIVAYSDDLTFRVFDLVGNEIHRAVISVNEGLNNHEFDGSRLANGIYLYTIEKEGALVSEKMIINR